MVLKDISWLWRTAYNCAVQGCSDWSDAEERAPRLFDVAREVWSSLTRALYQDANVSVKLLEAYCQTALVDVDEELSLCITFASFAAVSGRGNCLRSLVYSAVPDNPLALHIQLSRCGKLSQIPIRVRYALQTM